MPWTEITPSPIGGGSSTQPRITVSRRCEKAGRPRLFVAFSGAMMDALGWKKGATVSIQHDLAAGQIRLSSPGPWKLSNTPKANTRGSSVNFAFGEGGDKRAAEVVPHQIEEGGKAVVLTLPAWSVPQRAGMEGARAAQQQALARAAGPAPRNGKPFSIADSIPDPRHSVQRRPGVA